ncbi:MAG: hypothetical protein Q9213_005177 [Squamulea squamosa]
MNGDMVQKALAQLSGPTFVPVAFSFGWVVYSIQAFSSVIGTGRLMPYAPDVESMVVNVGSGHSRPNRSWILGRLLRDWNYEPTTVQGLYVTVLDAVSRIEAVEGIREQTLLSSQRDDFELPKSLGKRDQVQPNQNVSRMLTTLAVPGKPTPPSLLQGCYKRGLAQMKPTIRHLQAWLKIQLLDKGCVWIFAWVMIGLQLAIAAVPLRLHHDAFTMVITAVGTVLAIGYGALPRWKEEKHFCRDKTDQNFCLLEGNGAAHVMVVCGNGVGLNLEDLAAARVPKRKSIVPLTFVLTILSVTLLITIARKEGQTWFLMMIGGLGILQNIVVAGSPRPAGALGFYLRKRKLIYSAKVRDALCEAEKEVRGAGTALRPILFSGKATDADNEAFERATASHNETRGNEMEVATTSGRSGGEVANVSVGSRRMHGGAGMANV